VDGEIVNYTWNFGDGSISYERNPSHKYADNGVYLITLTVIDDDGATSWITKEIFVANVPPVANFTWQPIEPRDIDDITFNASSSYDTDGSIVNYTWNLNMQIMEHILLI